MSTYVHKILSVQVQSWASQAQATLAIWFACPLNEWMRPCWNPGEEKRNRHALNPPKTFHYWDDSNDQTKDAMACIFMSKLWWTDAFSTAKFPLNQSMTSADFCQCCLNPHLPVGEIPPKTSHPSSQGVTRPGPALPAPFASRPSAWTAAPAASPHWACAAGGDAHGWRGPCSRCRPAEAPSSWIPVGHLLYA